MTAYYNEIDPFAAAWLRELIKAGLIAPGVVDERDIRDVRPDELATLTQCHFFAGVGVWSHALRNAGWPDDRPVWTGSCPCQPFSAAGAGGGFADERHLWPHFHWLVEQCRPDTILGEQVASKDGLAWLDLVSSDLEGSGYAVGAVDTCSAGHGAPHIRQRLRFAAKRTANPDRDGRDPGREGSSPVGYGPPPRTNFGLGGVANTDDEGSQGRPGMPERADQRTPGANGVAVWLANPECIEEHEKQQRPSANERRGSADIIGGRRMANASIAAGPVNGFWRAADWLFCRDGKWRPVEPGTFPLAHGAAARVGRLRGYGNAVDAEATRIFIEAVLETEADAVRLNPSRMTANRSLFE